MEYNWNWLIFFEMSPDGTGTYLELLLEGFKWTLALSAVAGIIALILGVIIGTFKTVPNILLRSFANSYVELFRNIPLIVQMFLWYFVFPEVVPSDFGSWLKSLTYSSFYTGAFALGIYTSARIAVQVSSGIESLSRGQFMASKALGMSNYQSYRYVLLPAAIRLILPPLTSEFLGVIKNSAVALTIGLMELTAEARAMSEYSFNIFEAFTGATIIYVVLNIVVVSVMRYIEKKAQIPDHTKISNKSLNGELQ